VALGLPPVNDLLVTVGLILAAIGIGMSITAWRIRSLQYPSHLRWPKNAKSSRKRRSTRDLPQKPDED